MPDKKNTDYSASAVNLTNPREVISVLLEVRVSQAALIELQSQADAFIPETIKKLIKERLLMIENQTKKLKVSIDTYGSYQDTEKGEYALKQRRESITYRVDMVRAVLDAKLASLVIVEEVDGKALDGLVKGKLVTSLQAKECGEVKASYSYIIR